MKTRDLAVGGLVAAIYVVLTWAVAPIAYGPVQFRLAEILKPLALRGRVYIAGLSVGLFLANLLSPFAGTWELLVMPAACWVGGEFAYLLRRRPFVAVTFYSAWVAVSVGYMLHVLIGVPLLITVLWVFIPEIILMGVGLGTCDYILRRTEET